MLDTTKYVNMLGAFVAIFGIGKVLVHVDSGQIEVNTGAETLFVETAAMLDKFYSRREQIMGTLK